MRGSETDPNAHWKVVPLSRGQLLDVRVEDVLEDGLYRSCLTQRGGGGGYDLFPDICERRIGWKPKRQFIAQLFGCNLDCPYCYVTRAGVWGDFVRVSSKDMARSFFNSGLDVFHLMGGAPGLQLDKWPELIRALDCDKKLCGVDARRWVFHSDLMLTEGKYNTTVLNYLRTRRSDVLIAVNIKGYDDEEWRSNTRKEPNWGLFESNLHNLINCDVPFYVTFTNVSDVNISLFWEDFPSIPIIEDQVKIDLIDYKALKHVDDIPWGGLNE